IDVVPYKNAGYSARFPITETASAELRIILSTGEPIAAGSNAKIVNTGSLFPVAGNGNTYFQGLQTQNLVRVTLPTGKTCEFDLPYDPTDEPLPDLGTFVCHILPT
ncbi:MAG TPA: FimD/PapC C-terminal domain-containing protein, partial [Candidatus Obscuribacterales bacterium]